MDKIQEAAKKVVDAITEYCDVKSKSSVCQNYSGCEFCPVNETYNLLREEAGEKVTVTSIVWDADGEDAADLPDSVIVSVEKLSDAGYETGEISDYLSDEYGVCVKSYVVDSEGGEETK